jgi:hypothetical protein
VRIRPTRRANSGTEADAYKYLGLSLLDEAEHTSDPALRDRLRLEALVAFASARRLREQGADGGADDEAAA